MSKFIPGNQKHLTLEDRVFIENSLNQRRSFKDIAKYLCKDPTTISKEVKLRRASDWYHKGSFYNAKNFCVRRYNCRKVNVCNKILVCGIKCTSCRDTVLMSINDIFFRIMTKKLGNIEYTDETALHPGAS